MLSSPHADTLPASSTFGTFGEQPCTSCLLQQVLYELKPVSVAAPQRPCERGQWPAAALTPRPTADKARTRGRQAKLLRTLSSETHAADADHDGVRPSPRCNPKPL